jgi:hypothetical protein
MIVFSAQKVRKSRKIEKKKTEFYIEINVFSSTAREISRKFPKPFF